jgi:hypothetical protein
MAIFATQNPQPGETGLNWSEAQTGTTTRNLLAAAIGSSGFLGANDQLIFRGTYDYAGTQIDTTKSNINITAEAGKGFHITDPTVTGVTSYFLFRGDNVHISNLTVTSEGENGSGFNQFKSLFVADGCDNFVLEWCAIDCDLSYAVRLLSSPNAILRRNEFSSMSGWNSTRNPNSYAVACISLSNTSHNFLFEYNYCHNWRHEFLKTIKTGSIAPSMPVFRNNFVKTIGRDAIDTTGGWRGTGPSNRAIISDNIFISVALVIDAKNGPNNGAFGSASTKYVLMDGNKVYNSTSLIVSTLVNNPALLTPTPGDYYWLDGVPEDILCSNNEMQNCTRLGRIKAGIGIVFTNTKRRGSVGAMSIDDGPDLIQQNFWTQALVDAYFGYAAAGNPIYTESGTTTLAIEAVPTAPTFNYGPQGDVAEPSSDPRRALVGSLSRTNTDLGAYGPVTFMAGVENANGAASDSYTVAVS